MRSLELSPMRLSETPGFESSRQLLRSEAELPLFADSDGYDITAYQRAWETGNLRCFAVMDGDALVAWGVVTRAVIPRRAAPVYACDVLWSRDAVAGGLLLLRLFRFASPHPLFVTARRGGRLDKALAASERTEHTHNVYTITFD